MEEKLLHLHIRLSLALSQEDWDTVDRLSFTAATEKLLTKEEKQKKKFEKLASKKQASHSVKKTMVNLSKVELDEVTLAVLSKGLNFAMAPPTHTCRRGHMRR